MSPRRTTDLAVIERRENLKTERQRRARTEDNALEARLAETQALGLARGEALERAAQKRGEKPKPIRRLTGLDWLYKKGRISADEHTVGVRYGAVYRRALPDGRIASFLNEDRGQGDGAPMSLVMAHAEGSAQAASKLAMYRRQLGHVALIRACDLVCGQEKTPREASADGHEAGKLEAVLDVALGLLASAVGGSI
jgi:hypothetical protein